MTIPRIALGFVGVISIALALAGFWYNYMTFRSDFSALGKQLDIPYFYQAFYAMSLICILAYFLLLFIGVQFIRGRTDMVGLFTLLLVAEVLYFFAVGCLWTLPNAGTSIADATGVANGGLMFQGITLFPIWAPIIAYFSSQKLRQTADGRSFA